jgi:hypothetical protein
MVAFIRQHDLAGDAARQRFMSGVVDTDTRVAFASFLMGEDFNVPLDRVFNGAPLGGRPDGAAERAAAARAAARAPSEPVPGMPPGAYGRIRNVSTELSATRISAAGGARERKEWDALRLELWYLSRATTFSEWTSIVRELPGKLPDNVGRSAKLREILDTITAGRPDTVGQARRTRRWGRGR